MKLGIGINIDLLKLDKSRLREWVNENTGEKKLFLDLTTFINTSEEDKFGKHGFIAQELSKEERDAGAAKTPILGNCKVFYTDGGQAQKSAQLSQAPQAPSNAGFDVDDDLPF